MVKKSSSEKRIVLVTGASSGLGKQTAYHLANKGYTVYGTSRNASFPPMQKKQGTVCMIPMDVVDATSVTEAISYIYEQDKRIDVVINNAGWGISGAIEETPISQSKALFETNFFGVLRVCQSVLPIMRKQGEGLIINISSIGGVMGLPFQGLYSATKFAVEAITETLRMEVSAFGINVVLVEPGDFQTSFTQNRKKMISSSKESTYASMCNETISICEHDEQQGVSADRIAKLIETIINTAHPKLRYRSGAFSQRIAAKLKGVVPDRFHQWMLMKYYHLK